MGLKIGDTTKFYDVKARKSVNAKINKIKKTGGRRQAQSTSKSGTKLRKFIK